MYVKSFQIKGRDQRGVFAGVLDYITATLSRLRIILKEFIHVHIGREALTAMPLLVQGEAT